MIINIDFNFNILSIWIIFFVHKFLILISISILKKISIFVVEFVKFVILTLYYLFMEANMQPHFESNLTNF